MFSALVLGLAFSISAQDFGAHWQDGRAEVAGYRWEGVRYGEVREGQAVLVTVTEPFSERRRVKADRAGEDTVEAIKLNLVRDFQTGIYDYNTMTSVFVRSADMTPLKVTFSSAEWCGHVYEELLFEAGEVAVRTESYFEGESGVVELGRRGGDFSEDELFVALRGLRGAFMERGETREVRLLASAFERRLRHAPARWVEASITRAGGASSVEVPAGEFAAERYDVAVVGGRSGEFLIESAYPHRILSWTWRDSSGAVTDSGRFAGSERLAYWQLHGEGDERELGALGLAPLGRKD